MIRKPNVPAIVPILALIAATAAILSPETALSIEEPRKRPPKAAIEACAGKQEGDQCTFSRGNGEILAGECLSGPESAFACRPYRGVNGEVRPAAPEGQAPKADPSHESDHATISGSGGRDGTQPKLAAPAAKRLAVPSSTVPAAPLPSNVRQAPDTRAAAPTIAAVFAVGAVGVAALLLAAVLLSSGLTWYLFFYRSILPLRRLRRVTQQLAGGNLSVRVGEGLVHRRDEIADLARDVDRMAERTESLVGAHRRLIRDVSHELRSPLARLNVALELARDIAGPEFAAPFERIERESDRLNELIAHLLMLTRLESPEGIGQRTGFDLAELVKEVAGDVDFEARSSDRRVVALVTEPMPVTGNRELLRQALENLVRNAARYTDVGTAVDVSLRMRVSGGQQWAHIEVLDRGPGVPESELVNIFRPFYRVSDSRERESGGAGVGLAISDRAVRLHGGNVRASNAPPAGLKMEMDLPLQ
ncbi:sensor histidine kinase [Geomonas agri]|uniref:sensor histidine kinase n=1 Tax=Geomonas agri TaxID=2873702 RepID=UPI001CD7FD92|nr:ATP-binding protein [Geomonas agri]